MKMNQNQQAIIRQFEHQETIHEITRKVREKIALAKAMLDDAQALLDELHKNEANVKYPEAQNDTPSNPV